MKFDLKALQIFNSKLSKVEADVLYAALSRVGAGNHIYEKQIELAARINKQPSNINRTFKKLIKVGVFVRIKKEYYFNPHYGWRGDNNQRVRFLEKLDQLGYFQDDAG